MTAKRQSLPNQPAQSSAGGPKRGFFETALAAFSGDVREAFQEMGQGMLEVTALLHRKRAMSVSPREALTAVALDLDSLATFAKRVEASGEQEVSNLANRTARRLARLARQIERELGTAEDPR